MRAAARAAARSRDGAARVSATRDTAAAQVARDRDVSATARAAAGRRAIRWRERHLRARAAVLGALDGLAEAFERHDNEPRRARGHQRPRFATRLKRRRSRRGAARRACISSTRSPRGSASSITSTLVGLVETDWPERPRRNIFYTSGLLEDTRLAAGNRSGARRARGLRRFARPAGADAAAVRVPARGRRHRRAVADGRARARHGAATRAAHRRAAACSTTRCMTTAPLAALRRSTRRRGGLAALRHAPAGSDARRASADPSGRSRRSAIA